MANAIIYALFCVVVPVAWGLLVYWISTNIERRVLRDKHTEAGPNGGDDEGLYLDYYI